MKIREFLKDHLAKRSQAVDPEIKRQFTPDQQMEMEMSGADGGVFTLFWRDGEFYVEERKAETPMIRVQTKARDFLDLMTGRYNEFVDITKLDANSQLMLDPVSMMTPKKLDLLKKLTGTLCIQYCSGTTPNDDVMSESYMSFNGEPVNSEAPRCTVIMPVDNLERIAKGEVTPPQLMVAGRMRVVGDMQLVVQMSPLLR